MAEQYVKLKRTGAKPWHIKVAADEYHTQTSCHMVMFNADVDPAKEADLQKIQDALTLNKDAGICKSCLAVQSGVWK